ncbi:MAG TPA: DNA alkylation repair protein [Planctomycetota bacterium]|nr:DNA alkylation repair protein [Planctomycetota bacterium]
MSYSLKSFFSPDLVRRLATDVARVHPAFPKAAFVRQACRGLDGLELLDRGRHIAAALGDHLPPDYPAAVDVLLRSLGPEHAGDELIGLGMAPFFYFPHVAFVAERGLGHFDLSMQAQYELTKRFSAEASVRPYIAADPERAFAWFRRWKKDPNPHVRRLVSEGTRLRLPWAPRVPWLDAHPERIVELLETLKDDPATLVRRSVANNLNDLGKLDPALLVRVASQWSKGASAERRALIEHALRGAVKRGDRAALGLLGFGSRPSVVVENVRFEPPRVAIGANVSARFALRGAARGTQNLLVDLAVHFVKANGKASPKVFKLNRVTLPPRGVATFATRISLAVHTTRKPFPGAHRIDVLVNGAAFPAGSFEVVPPPGPTSRKRGASARPTRRKAARGARGAG